MDLVKKSERDLEHMRSGRLAMTGSWLAGLEDYNRWIDFESGTSSILLLTGDTGSGKSRLAYAILDRYVFSEHTLPFSETTPQSAHVHTDPISCLTHFSRSDISKSNADF